MNQVVNEIDRMLTTLTPREADILRKSFGLGTPKKSLEEIGDELHLEREQVRQLKEKAIRKLWMHKEGLESIKDSAPEDPSYVALLNYLCM